MRDSYKLPPSDDPHFEYLARQASLDCQVTHQLLLLESDIIKSVTELMDSLHIQVRDKDTVDKITSQIALFHDTNGLAKQSNFRARSLITSVACKAKLNIRDVILSKSSGEPCVMDALRGSCFLSEGVFGPIPQVTQTQINNFTSRADGRLSFQVTTTRKKRPASPHPSRGGGQKRGTHSTVRAPVNYHTPASYCPVPLPSSSKVPQATSLFADQPRRGQRGKHNKRGKGSRR